MKPLTKITHGSAYSYNKGCRCDLCRAANSSRRKKKDPLAGMKAHVIDSPPRGDPPTVPTPETPVDRGRVHEQCDREIARRDVEIERLNERIRQLDAEVDFWIGGGEVVELDPPAPRKFCKYCGRGPYTPDEQVVHMETIHSGDNQALEVDR